MSGIIETRSSPYNIARPAGNDTTATITDPVPTLTAPSGEGVINMGIGGLQCPNGLLIVPYGAGSATNTFSLAVYGWCFVETKGVLGTRPIWVAIELANWLCTMGTMPGLANSPVDASQLFCGTIAMVRGNANVSNETISPTSNRCGHVTVDNKGCQFAQIKTGTGSSATSANALWKTL